MTANLQILAGGISLGCVFALLALGFVIVTKSTGVFNLAQGGFVVLGAYLTYALHQQAMPVPAHVPGVSFGTAVSKLAASEGSSADAVTRRFMAVATAVSIDEVLVHVRGLVTQLRSRQLGFDYAKFADDLHLLLNPQYTALVRLSWGRDFYRTGPDWQQAAPTDREQTSRSDEEEK